MFTDFFNAAAFINLLILPLTDRETISMPPNDKNFFICLKKCEGLTAGCAYFKSDSYLIE